MKILCSECRSRYSLRGDEIKAIEYETFRCGNCGRNIKVIICPECGKAYSIAYTAVSKRKYMVECKACENRFAITFPPNEHTNPTYRAENTEPPHARQEPRRQDARPQAGRNEQTRRLVPPQEGRQAAGRARQTAVQPIRLFAVLKASFAKERMVCAAAGLVAVTAFNIFMRAVLPLLPAAFQKYGAVAFIYSLVFIFIYMFTAGCVSESAFAKLSLPAVFKTTAKKSLPLFTASFLVSGIFWAGIFIFSNMPTLPPVFFGLILLPVYLLFFLAGTASAAGFWFYAPFTVDPLSSRKKLRGFFAFTKRPSQLICVIAFLVIVSALSIGFVSFIHSALIFLLSKAAQAAGLESLSAYLSSVPSGIKAINSFSYYFRIFGYFNLSRSPAVLVCSLFLSAFSIFLTTWLLSWIMSLSAYFYKSLAEGIKARGIKFICIFLIISALCLAFYLAFRVLI